MGAQRLRRLRSSPAVRALTSETRLDPSRFLLPVFAADGMEEEQPLDALPGHFYWPPGRIGVLAKEAQSVGVPGLLIFGVTDEKDEYGSLAKAADGPAQRAIKEVKAAAPDMAIFADTCLCGYTSHGHCGIVQNGVVLNEPSVEALAEVAVSQAAAGADFVSPSDMMDGRVAAIRRALDENGFSATGIMSYSGKFASSMYGPFREVAGTTPQFGDRRSYQIDPPDRRQALASLRRDLDEGADIVMIKPALPYLDVILEARQRFEAPISAYNVSGEYAMVKAASEKSLLDERRAVLEILTSIVRAGADFVVTLHALDAARWLSSDR